MKAIAHLFVFIPLIMNTFKTYGQAGNANYLVSIDNKTFLNSSLSFNGSQSLFLVDIDNPITNKPTRDNLSIDESGENKQVITVKVADGKPLFVHKDFKNNIITSREVLYNGDKAILEEDSPRFDWKIESETKEIAGIACQRATLSYRCAKYTAWFAPSIPLRFGPWKMSGLPGLILELTNETVNHSYLLTSLSIPSNLSTPIEEQLRVFKDKRMNYKEFSQKQQVELEKMRVYLSGMAGDSDGKFEAKVPECFN